MSPPCIYKDYNIIKRVTLAYIVITIIGNYYMSFFGYSYFTINKYKQCYRLRDIPEYYFYNKRNRLNGIELKRGIHYYTEMNRVKEGLRAWRNNDIDKFGKLMNESCLSSINNYESGSKYLIDLFNIARNVFGVMGIRFLGAGFNGSCLGLIKKNRYKYIKDIITKEYCDLYPELINDFKIIKVSLCDGVKYEGNNTSSWIWN